MLCALGCEPAPREGRFSGCPVVDEGPVCVLQKPAELTIWVEGASLPVNVSLNGETLAHQAKQLGSGVRVTLTAQAPGRLTIDDAKGRFSLSLAGQSRAGAEAIRTSTAARAHLRRGDWSQAARLLERSMRAHAQAGAWSWAIRDGQAAAFALVQLGAARRRRLLSVLWW